MTRALTVGIAALLNMPPEGLIESLSSRLVISAGRREPRLEKLADSPLAVSLFGREAFIDVLRHWNATKTISMSEAANIYAILEDEQRHQADFKNLGIFSLILSFAQKHLVFNGHELLCRHNEFVLWREAVHVIGQTPFICAYLAAHDQKNQQSRTVFDFSPYLKTDDYHLRQILARGVAENHFHLYGSSPAFLINWICLMNHTEVRERDFKNLGPILSTSGGDFDRIFSTSARWSLHDLVRLAAGLRLHIWEILTGGRQEETIGRGREFLSAILQRNWSGLQSGINGHRALLTKSLDYTLDTGRSNGAYAVVSGENYFLYRVFYGLFNRDPGLRENIDCIYAYLLIYCRMRSELIQTNDAVGFVNFQKYQDRKTNFIRDARYARYNAAFTRVALESALAVTGMKSLEARINPSASPDEQIKHIASIMKSLKPTDTRKCVEDRCRFFDVFDQQCTFEFGRCKDKLNMISLVMHIAKREDEKERKGSAKDPLKPHLVCRHQKYRKANVSRPVQSVMALRRKAHTQAKYIYALDACSNEIGCRPEVFAPSFRRARGAAGIMPAEGPVKANYIPPLHITYHVGEDFLDIVDGLRAIDEAIRFLDLKNSDRLGHALALGVAPHKFYSTKNFRVFLPRQDLLDNAAWFYMTMQKFNIDSPDLLFKLRETFREQYNAVYAPCLGSDFSGGAVPSIEIYYDAWKLRGDDPDYYRDPSTQEDFKRKRLTTDYDSWALQNSEDVRHVRDHDSIAWRLYHNYHFNPQVKEKGRQMVEFHILPCYMAAVGRLQRAMQEYIADKGLGIECNLSSNYLIGTFRQYAEHPVLIFNNDGLDSEPAAQLMTSINTDDQGVFDTDLESEYALLACTLKNERDQEGRPLYPPVNIYKYINRIRKLGLAQSFRKLDQNLGGERKIV